MEWLKEIHALRNVTTHMGPRGAQDPRAAARRELFAFFERGRTWYRSWMRGTPWRG
jgi:hypothetical protein